MTAAVEAVAQPRPRTGDVHVWVVRADVDSATGRGDEPEVGRIMRLKAENAPLHADVEVLAAAPSSDDHW